MEFHIVWPSFWWNIAFAIACVVFVLARISNKTRENDESGGIISNILLNEYLWIGLCILSFLASFILTLYLLHYGKGVKDNYDTTLVLVLYTVLGILIPLVITAAFADNNNEMGCLEGAFIFSAGNSFFGLIFLICNVFSYMWVDLGFLIFDILGVIVASYIKEKDSIENRRARRYR